MKYTQLTETTNSEYYQLVMCGVVLYNNIT